MIEVDTKRNIALKNQYNWQVRMVPHKYLEDVKSLNQVGKDNFLLPSTKNKLATANSPYNGVNYWAKNVVSIKSAEGPINYNPNQLHPLFKSGLGNSWAPYKFAEPTDNYRTTPGKYIKY